jgi:hypothetical protein
MRLSRPGWTLGLTIFACLLLCLAALIYPVYVIRPFRGQGSRELIAALMLMRFRMPLVAGSAFVSAAAMIWHWKRERRWLRRTGSLLGTIAVIGAALLCRINIYELMFHPFGRPSFSAAGQVKLDSDEKVISVNSGQNARAYPIRVISYHHVINDDLAGVPIVATY